MYEWALVLDWRSSVRLMYEWGPRLTGDLVCGWCMSGVGAWLAIGCAVDVWVEVVLASGDLVCGWCRCGVGAWLAIWCVVDVGVGVGAWLAIWCAVDVGGSGVRLTIWCTVDVWVGLALDWRSDVRLLASGDLVCGLCRCVVDAWLAIWCAVDVWVEVTLNQHVRSEKVPPPNPVLRNNGMLYQPTLF